MYKDKVKCNWCNWSGLVERAADVCPSCKERGYLMDIDQDIEAGGFKEVWAKQREEIERTMDEITAEYGEILSIGNYIDHLYDFYEMDVLEDFYAVIVEYQDELIWNYENEKAKHETKFKKAMAAGGLMYLEAAENGK